MTLTETVRADLRLSEKRLRHTEGVVKAALLLASRHYPILSPQEVELAALLHDYTKEYTTERQLALCTLYGIALSDEELRTPKLLHARTAAAIAADRYQASAEVCAAVRWHTTGRPDMSPLETVIYFADYIEEGRDYAPCIRLRNYYEKQYRTLKDKTRALNKGLVRSFDMTVKDLLADRKPIFLLTVEARNAYLRLL